MESVAERPISRPNAAKRALRWTNLHLREDGALIYSFAKKLPLEEREQVLKQASALVAARRLGTLPATTRNVITGLIIGQGMWYVACPLISHIPHIRDTALGWLAWGGSDKLFIAPTDLIAHTGGYSTGFAAQLADKAPKTIAAGAILLGAELITDISRCWTEYWLQKKYGIVPDGLARAWGQTRPFAIRFSSIEVWQKIVGYVLQPWKIGTPAQLFSSMQGILGSVWRTVVQLPLAATVGRAIDKMLKDVSRLIGLKRLADRMIAKAARKEGEALENIKACIGEERFTALRFQLAAEARKCWRWNPFAPALPLEKAELAAKVVSAYAALEKKVAGCTGMGADTVRAMYRDLVDCRLDLFCVFSRKGWHRSDGQLRLDQSDLEQIVASGRKMLRKSPSYAEYENCWSKFSNAPSGDSLAAVNTAFGRLLAELQTERQLR